MRVVYRKVKVLVLQSSSFGVHSSPGAPAPLSLGVRSGVRKGWRWWAKSTVKIDGKELLVKGKRGGGFVSRLSSLFPFHSNKYVTISPPQESLCKSLVQLSHLPRPAVASSGLADIR